jgi:hypothetical protein
MSRVHLWGRSVPRVELDQRAREARLRLEQVQRLLVGRGSEPRSRLDRVLRLVGIAIFRGRSRRLAAARRSRAAGGFPEIAEIAVLTCSPRNASRIGGDRAKRPMVPETSLARSPRRARPAGPKAPPAHFARLRAC